MMILFFLLYVVVCLYGARLCTKGNEAYLSMDTTNAVKGIFILLVFFSHFNSYVPLAGQANLLYTSIVGGFGQTMVTLFLFYSGYGVMESLKKKGAGYIDSFPVKRILATLFRFDCAVLIFLIIGLAFKAQYSLPQILLSFLGWETLGNSNWYIFVILVLYLITYLAFKLIPSKNYIIQASAIALATGIIILASWRFNIKDLYWYDTALCYVLGMFYSLFRSYWEAIGKTKTVLIRNLIWIVSLVLVTASFLFLKRMGNTPAYLLSNLAFTLIVVCLTMRIHIGNRFLIWCGTNLFELYILQRIPMILLKNLGIAQLNVYLYFILCFIFTILLMKPFKYFTSFLWKLLPFK